MHNHTKKVKKVSKREILDTLSEPKNWVLCVIGFCLMISSAGMSGFLPTIVSYNNTQFFSFSFAFTFFSFFLQAVNLITSCTNSVLWARHKATFYPQCPISLLSSSSIFGVLDLTKKENDFGTLQLLLALQFGVYSYAHFLYYMVLCGTSWCLP